MNPEQHQEPGTLRPEPRPEAGPLRPEPRFKVLIVRLGSLGDLVHALPAVAAIRDAHPDAQIDWLVEKPHAALLHLVPALSNVIVLKGRSMAGWWATRRELRAHKYDIALDLQGLVKSAVLARLSGATRVVGFDTKALREPGARFFYTEQVQVGEGRHVIEKNLECVEQALRTLLRQGSGGQAPHSALRTAHCALRTSPSPALTELRAAGVGDFALLNPGAAWPNKRWPPESFAAVAQWLHATYGWTPVVLWGPGEEALADAIVAGSNGLAVRAPKTTFNDLLVMAGESQLFLSGDTGPLHLACAMGAPVVALFGPTTERRNGPWDDRDVSISRYDQCACHYQRVCRLRSEGASASQGRQWCLGTITVDEVTAAISRRVAQVASR